MGKTGQQMILIFAGAGASYAVHNEWYPTALDFFNRLPDSVRSAPLFKHACDFARKEQGHDTIDIEDVLSILNQAHNNFSASISDQSPAGYFYQSGRAASILGGPPNAGNSHEVMLILSRLCEEMRDNITSEVYSLYNATPNTSDLNATWAPLLTEVLQADSDVEIVTTNYDVVIEETLRVCGIDGIDTGRVPATFSTLNLDFWSDSHEILPTKRHGLLTKLHGSVDWIWSSERKQIRIGNPDFLNDHSNRVILYPGFKGSPTEEPFILFHQHFENVVAKADYLIFIGFAFRDEYINSILRKQVRPDSTIYCLNPVTPAHSPFKRPFHNFVSIEMGFREGLATLIDQLHESRRSTARSAVIS